MITKALPIRFTHQASHLQDLDYLEKLLYIYFMGFGICVPHTTRCEISPLWSFPEIFYCSHHSYITSSSKMDFS